MGTVMMVRETQGNVMLGTAHLYVVLGADRIILINLFSEPNNFFNYRLKQIFKHSDLPAFLTLTSQSLQRLP